MKIRFNILGVIIILSSLLSISILSASCSRDNEPSITNPSGDDNDNQNNDNDDSDDDNNDDENKNDNEKGEINNTGTISEWNFNGNESDKGLIAPEID